MISMRNIMSQQLRSEEVTVLFHGPVRSETLKAIQRCRKFLPEAEIVFSTWIGQNVASLPVDKCIFSEEPQAYIQHKSSGTLNNLNRQIRSIKKGLEHVTRKYTLRMRSDLLLDNTFFFNLWNRYPKKVADYSIFKKKLIVGTLFSRIKYKGRYTPFHISDWYCFGLTEDVKKYYSAVEEVMEPQFTQYFLNKRKKSPFGSTTFRFAPEQYITYSAWEKYKALCTMNDASDITKDIVQCSRCFIVSNFIVCSYLESGMRLEKYQQSKDERQIGKEWFSLYSPYIYQYEYKNWCDSDFKIESPDEVYFKYKNFYVSFMRIKKHWMDVRTTRGLKLLKAMSELAYIVFIFLVSLPFFIMMYLITALNIKRCWGEF